MTSAEGPGEKKSADIISLAKWREEKGKISPSGNITPEEAEFESIAGSLQAEKNAEQGRKDFYEVHESITALLREENPDRALLARDINRITNIVTYIAVNASAIPTDIHTKMFELKNALEQRFPHGLHSQ